MKGIVGHRPRKKRSGRLIVNGQSRKIRKGRKLVVGTPDKPAPRS